VSDRVLVIDDNLIDRLKLKGEFESAGFDVVLCSGAGQARKTLEKSTFNLILLDVMLGDGDGIELLQELRSKPNFADLPIIVLSAADQVHHRTRGLTSGANEYMGKPYDSEQLLARARHLIGEKRRANALNGTRPPRVLVTDDSGVVLQTIEAALRQEGFDVILAESGEAALGVLSQEEVDCILLDLNMPGLGGQETCKKIKSSMAWRHIPLVILTGDDSRKSLLASLSAGADDYIVKSNDSEILRARVKAQLRRKQIEDENRRIRDELVQKEMDAARAQAATELAEARKHMLEELQKNNAELEAAKQRAERESGFKTKFLANMSHELRTPLNAIIGFSELLDQEIFGPLQPRQKEYVRNVLHSGQHLLGIINDILDLSSVEAGRLTLTREMSSIGAIVDSVHTIVAALAKRQDITLEVDIPKNLPKLSVDPLRIKQVLYNLLSNGIKFTPRGGKVRLVARADGHARIEIAISDTGIGIRAEDLPKLFKEFARLEPGPGVDVRPEGTGLGLALTKRLVELHQGDITIQSTHGKGTTVTVTLPITAPA